MTAMSDRRMPSKLRAILQYGSHPLHNALVKQRSTFTQRLIAPKCITERHRKSFLPYFIIYFIVYFNISFYFIVYFTIVFMSLSLSLVSIHAVFLFLLCMEHLEQKQFLLLTLIKNSDSADSDSGISCPLNMLISWVYGGGVITGN